MARKNIFEILKESYNIENELEKIRQLFDSELLELDDFDDFDCYSSTIEKAINTNSNVFYDWTGRGSCVNSLELREILSIDRIIRKAHISEDEIILCLEYFYNMIGLASVYESSSSYFFKLKFNILVDNMSKLLEHLNHHSVEIDKNMFILVPKNPEAIAVAEISSKDTALAIMKYHHASLKGNLKEKRNLLLQISQEYEPLLSSKIDNYNDFLGNANALLNNLNIRHNNTSSEGNKNTVISISDKELEKWYDELYQLLLFCVLIKDNLERKSKISKFLKQIKE